MERLLTPADANTLSSVELVREALASHVNFKVISAALERRTSDTAAAEILVAAFARGDAPAWLTAHLLGCLRAVIGYETVRGILLAAPGLLAESYAGCALAKIRGPEALSDLVDILYNAPKRVSREGAAYGLGSLGTSEAGEALLAACSLNRIRVSTGGSILGQLPFDQVKVSELLASDEERLVRLGTEAVWSLARASDSPARPSVPPHPNLVSAVRGVLSDTRVSMAPHKREALSAWVARHGAVA